MDDRLVLLIFSVAVVLIVVVPGILDCGGG
jgi:hypothetical protein